MSINFEKAFGIHDTALTLRAERAEVLASNLANADTPNYKARDIDFAKMLQNASASQSSALRRTHQMHIDSQALSSSGDIPGLSYRIPFQPDTGDGNTVDAQIEQTKFAENAMQYQTSLHFLDRKVKGLIGAIRGE